ncbi:MAG: peptidylprolyl isomerase [Flavobacteriales bacterium]
MKKISLLVLGLFLLVAANAQKAKLIDGTIGTIGSKLILHSEVEAQLLQAKQEGFDLGENARCLVYEEIMFQSLLMYQADVDSVIVSPEQVNGELNNRIRYFENQIGGRKKLEEYYGKSIDDIKSEFYRTIENRMKAERMRGKITSAINITPSDVKKYYKGLDRDSIPLVESKVEVAHITKAPKVSEEVKKETKEKLAKWREEIVSGERTFSTTAVLYSNDPGSRGQGGEFDWVTRGTFVPEFDRVAFKIDEGSVSQVFETDYGFHILELFERRGDQYRGRHILLIPKISEAEVSKAKVFLDSIKSLIDNGTYTFEEAAKKFSDDKETRYNGGLIYNQQSASSKFEMKQLDKQVFLIIDDLKEKEYSKPILSESKDGQFYQMVKLKSISKPHKANLKDDYQFILQNATNAAKADAIKKWIKNKSKSTYIKIHPDYAACEFVRDWIK